MKFEEIESKINEYKRDGKLLFTTSSFQTHSIPLLHIISRIEKSIPVYFINTGYHFPETLEFRDHVTELLGLNLVDLKPDVPKSMQKGADGKLLFTSDPDHCCYLNKVQPLEKVMMHHDIWINGVRADQSATRKAMQVEQPAPHGVTRFHPILDWTPKEIYQYKREFNLPAHPLDLKGYQSVGCEPCTRKLDPEMMDREARWYGLNKVECGLHTELVSK